MDSSLTSAIQQICDEKGISVESVIETIEAALAAAYRKDYGSKNQNIKVNFSMESGDFKVYDEKTVVDKPVIENNEQKEGITYVENNEKETEEDREARFNPKNEIQIADALEIKKDANLGDVIRIDLEVHKEFGRMASQTAKQVIIQKLREAERQTLYDEFKKKEKEILIGTVQRSHGKNWLIDVGKATAILPREERILQEDYKQGMKLKFFIISVEATSKGPEIIVSRAHPEILRKLFWLEIPEIASHVVEIKALAREAGSRAKVAVKANEENIDPIGACVGQRGARIQTIISELGGEKVDIIMYHEDIKKFIANSLSPAKVLSVEVDERSRVGRVLVNEDQLSLAIGKAGQNVRLAAKLTGWKINIKSVEGKEFAMEEVIEGINKEEEIEKKNKDESEKANNEVTEKIGEEKGAENDKEGSDVKKEEVGEAKDESAEGKKEEKNGKKKKEDKKKKKKKGDIG